MNKVGWIRGSLHEKRDSMNAYLVFAKEESVAKALVENGSLFLGKHIRVDYANPDPVSFEVYELFCDLKKREKFTLFVGNLPYDASEEEVRTHFAKSGGITNVHIVRATGVGIGKGVAYISFSVCS
jgi:nucleolar protein 12